MGTLGRGKGGFLNGLVSEFELNKAEGQGAIPFWKILELEITKNPEFEKASKPCSWHLVLDIFGVRVQGGDKLFALCKIICKIYRR